MDEFEMGMLPILFLGTTVLNNGDIDRTSIPSLP
jgi:hypothetical protein